MSTVAQLDIDSVSVEAGDRVSLPLNVRNTGDVVEDYQIDIVGVPSAWTTIEPSQFTLYPGTAQLATVEIHPPRSSDVPAGEVRFGVHVVPTEHPDQAVVPEAVVEVLPYLETTAELVPRTSHGRFGAKHQVAIDNRGNVPVTVLLVPAVESEALAVKADPESVTVEPGMATFADIRVKSTERIWRGVPKTHPFGLVVAPQGSPEVRLDAAHVQDPVFPPWLIKALLALLALLIALLALWFLVLKPTIESAAQDAVAEPVQQASQQAAAASQAANAAGQSKDQATAAAQQAQSAATSAAGSAATPPAKPPTSTGPVLVTAPTADRLTVEAAAGAQDTDTFTVAEGETLKLTDLVLENTQGDSGLLTLRLGDRVILTQALESFRTTDYHFVTPFVAQGPVQVQLSVQCNAPGTPPDTTPAPDRCRNAVTFGGQLTAPAS